MLIATDIHKGFKNGQLQVLKGLSATIAPGQITCLIGPSGAGKTTLLRALALLDAPDKGRLQINGDTYDFPLGKDQKIAPPWPDLTVVFQTLFLWPHLTLFENIALPARNVIKDPAELEMRVNEMAVAFDMTGYLNRYPNEASLGQRQRVALARALILNPKYVLLDEITSALDVEQVERILNHLILLRERGVGLFLITHLLGFARRAADQILFMNEGTIQEAGSAEILSCPQTQGLQRFLRTVNAAA